jgi:glycosyltransferase involved in cell wall biosynthesis
LTERESLVSVVIPVFNAEKYIAETIESILAQTYSNLEIIAIDDGSTDRSPAIINRYKNVSYFFQENSGTCSVPRNNGLKHSSGEFICFFDADDIMEPRKIEIQVEFLKKHKQIQAVICDYINFSDKFLDNSSHFDKCILLTKILNRRGFYREMILESHEFRKILPKENFIIANSPLFRTKFLKDFQAFDPELRASEDFDLMYRVAMKTNIGIIATIGFKRRLHESNMSKNTIKILKWKIICREKLLKVEKDKKLSIKLRENLGTLHYELALELRKISTIQSLKHLLLSMRYEGIKIKHFVTATRNRVKRINRILW